MTIKIKSNTKDYIKKLKKQHGGLAITGANTVNDAAEIIKDNYDKELKKFTLRNKYTLGAVRLFKSKPQSSSGDFRPLKNINAKVIVRKMKGGKDHYLKKQEEGDIKRGHANTLGGVPVPLDSARTSGSHTKPIKSALRLQKTTVQTLSIAGQKLGVPGSRWQGKQAWALLYKYRKNNRYGWDMSKQFFFTGIQKGLGIFKSKGKKFDMVRTLDDKSVTIKKTNKFKRSVNKINESKMENLFVKNARRFLSK